MSRERRRWTIGDPIPAICMDADLIAILGIHASTYCLRKKQGLYERLLLRNPDGTVTRPTQYSGHLIERWLHAQPLTPAEDQPAPATPPKRQFLKSARRGMRRTPGHSNSATRPTLAAVK